MTIDDVVKWILSLGFHGTVSLKSDVVTSPIGSYIWNHLTFTQPDKAVPVDSDPTIAITNPGTVAQDLVNAGMLPVGTNTQWIPPVPVLPPVPQPVDTVVGIPDPSRPGKFQPTEKVSPMWLYGQFSMGQPYLSPTGRKFLVVPIGGGMMTSFEFEEV